MSTVSTATISSSSLYRIEPLKGENYATWKVKMKLILMDTGMWGHADGTAQRPDPAEDTAVIRQWERDDQLALSAICLRVADTHLVYVSGAKTAAEAWRALSDMFEAKGPIGIVIARRKFFRAQCDGQDIEEHIRLLRSYQEELHTLGQKVTEEDFCITLLTSLPDSWNAFISAIDITSLQSSTSMISRILEEERRIQYKQRV